MSADTEEILIRREGCAGRITLNRPQALNAVTLGMIRAMRSALDDWRDEPGVELIILDGAGDRALAAGGDLRSMYEARGNEDFYHRVFWHEEYQLNALIARYPKPFLAIMDGIVMGGGIGLSAHASHRIVTERSHLAMPETAIGLLTDVGGTYLLARAPGESGIYLGLTGSPLNAADAVFTGFADNFVSIDALADLLRRFEKEGVGALDRLLAAGGAEGPSPLRERLAAIDRLFGFGPLEEICAALAAEPGDWAGETLAGMRKRSPLAMKATLAAIRAARTFETLEQALAREYRYVCRLFEGGEFIEGVRALVIDKDRAPRWRPPRIEDVTDEMVSALGAPMPDGEEFSLSGPPGLPD